MYNVHKHVFTLKHAHEHMKNSEYLFVSVKFSYNYVYEFKNRKITSTHFVERVGIKKTENLHMLFKIGLKLRCLTSNVKTHYY